MKVDGPGTWTGVPSECKGLVPSARAELNDARGGRAPAPPGGARPQVQAGLWQNCYKTEHFRRKADRLGIEMRLRAVRRAHATKQR